MRYLALCLLMPAPPAYAAVCDSNLMIVEDRSCSMNDRPTGGGAQTQWEIATQGLNQPTPDYASKPPFALIIFPHKTGDNRPHDGPLYVSLRPTAGAAR